MTWGKKTAKKRKTNPFIAHRKMMVQIEKWKEIQSTIDYENQICFMRWIENAFSGNNVQTESNSGKRKMMKTHGIWNSIYRFYRIFHRNNNPTAYHTHRAAKEWNGNYDECHGVYRHGSIVSNSRGFRNIYITSRKQNICESEQPYCYAKKVAEIFAHLRNAAHSTLENKWTYEPPIHVIIISGWNVESANALFIPLNVARFQDRLFRNIFCSVNLFPTNLITFRIGSKFSKQFGLYCKITVCFSTQLWKYACWEVGNCTWCLIHSVANA